MREHGSNVYQFNTLYMDSEGAVNISGTAGTTGITGTYESGRTIHLRIVHDLDAGTYDLW